MGRQPAPGELRDHLANERTLLAWVRTAIAIAALGFVVAKFGILLREVGGSRVHTLTERAGAVVGTVLVLAAVVLVIFATLRFMRIRRDIERQMVVYSPALDIALAVIVGVVSVILAVYIIVTA